MCKAKNEKIGLDNIGDGILEIVNSVETKSTRSAESGGIASTE
jgi:hypothetical protein